MKSTPFWMSAKLAGLALLTLANSSPAADLIRFNATPSSKVTIEGSSNIHDWTVEGQLVGGYIELDPSVGSESQKPAPGKIPAKVEVSIPVRSLKSRVAAGKARMEEIMLEHLKYPEQQKITYQSTELTLKEVPTAAGGPYVFDSKGELTVAGAKKTITMPVKMVQISPVRLEFTCSITLKMSDFGIETPAPKITGGLIKTADEVKVSLDWVTVRPAGSGAPAAK
ncbi:MAG: YceI family protein [Limisphaerales bacterium]